MKYWEDFKVGESTDLGSHSLTEAEILAFARKYDPQPFHTDLEAARRSIFGGLIASGWHTCAIMMRLIYDGFILGKNAASMGAPGIDEVKWLKPVRPGDTLSMRLTVLGKSQPKSRSDLGFVQCRCEVLNQHGEAVLEATYPGMFAKRDREAAE